MENRNLNNTIKIGEETYNLNAVKSDTADKVEYSLTLEQSNFDETYTDTEYNGSAAKSIDFVSAKNGGTFYNPIKIKNNTPENFLTSPNTVVTYEDVTALVQKLDGATWYTWDGENLKANTVTITDAQGKQELAYEPMAVVVGESSEISSFNDYNDDPYNQNKLPLYLYIGTYSSTNNNRAGDLFLGGTALNVSLPIPLASRATSLYDSTEKKTRTASNIFSTLDKLSSDNIAHTNQIKNIINGTQKVGLAIKAENADNAINADNAKKAENATNADKATDATYAQYDVVGKEIRYNYYRTYGSYADNTVINSIRIVPGTKPSNNDGNLGDICIVY